MLRRPLTQIVRRPLARDLFDSSLGVKLGPRWSPKLKAGYRYQVSYRDGPRYERFQTKENIFVRWARRPTFYYEVGLIGGAGGLFYVYNLEQVPETGRRRFNVISAEQEKSMSEEMYKTLIQEHRRQILPSWDRRTELVQRVLDRLISGSGLSTEGWEVHVIQDPQANAFVIPGGKVFVFSGLLPIAQDEDGLATVLGHEIAHNVAHHSAERMSKSIILLGLATVLQLYSDPFFGSTARALMDFLLLRPGSRAQESEADYIGLSKKSKASIQSDEAYLLVVMMAQSCFDPSAALGLWERMEKTEVKIPQFLSTHPSSHDRRQKIAEWLSKAEEQRANSGCAPIQGHVDAFKKTVERVHW